MNLLFRFFNDCLYPFRKPRTLLQDGFYPDFQCYQVSFQHFVVVRLYSQQSFGGSPFRRGIDVFGVVVG